MKLNLKRTMIVGLAFLTISMFWQLYDYTIPLIMKHVFHASDTVSGVVMALDNVLALFLLPVIGSLSDKVQTRYGKRMPFIVLGSIATIISLILIPYAAQMDSLGLFAVALVIVLLSVASYRSPAVALMPDVTPKPLRSEGNAIINLMGAVGGSIFLVLNALLGTKKTGSYFPVFLSVALLMAVGVLVMILYVRENRWVQEMHAVSAQYGVDDQQQETQTKTQGNLNADVRRSLSYLLLSIALWFMGYNAVTSAFSRYAIDKIGMSDARASMTLLLATVGAIVSYIPIGWYAARYGRKRTILTGIVVLALSFATAFFYTSASLFMYVNFLLAGFGWAAINVNSLPMVLEMAKDADVGKYTGLYYTFSMSAQIVTPILSGVLFDRYSYRVLFPYAACFLALSFITMIQVQHGDSKLPTSGKKVG